MPISRVFCSFIAASLLGGCGAESSMEWMEGASYRWDLFNHRVSHLHFAVDEQGPVATIVGGTSTTGVSTVLEPSCDSDTCSEFPFFDEAQVSIDWVRATSKKARFAAGSGDLVVGAAGASTDVQVTFDKKAKDDLVAVLRGFRWDTNEPLEGGDACYTPANGWLPRRLAITLGEPTLADDRLSASVPVEAFFEAGVTFEDERQCLDAVVDQAQVRLMVDLAVIGGAKGMQEHQRSHGVEYTYGDGPSEPDEQPDPDLSERQVDLGDSEVVGWTSLDYRFFQGQGDTRGAYIRTLSFLGTPAGLSSGHANNYSPATQLSGFDYQFVGTMISLELPGEIRRVHSEDLIDIDLDDDGVPIPQAL